MPLHPKRWPLSVRVLVGLLIGIFLGLYGRSEPYLLGMDNADLGQIGMLIIRLLKALAIPLILFGIMDAFIQTRITTRSGLRLVFICLINVSMAFTIGLALMNWVKPGLAWRGHLDRLIALAPSQANPPVLTNVTLDPLHNLGGYIPQSLLEPILNNNVISIVLMAILFGAALGSLKRDPPEHGAVELSPLENSISAIYHLLVRVLDWVVKIVPLAVLCLVAQAVGKSGLGIFSDLAGYLGIIALGLCLHGLIYYPLVAWFAAGVSPRKYLGGGADAVLSGMSTNSSLASVPITLQCLKQIGVGDNSARLAACAGTNLNNDGVTLYEAMTALFLAQAIGLDLDAGQQIVIVLAALMAGVGIAGVPEAGLIVLPLVLGAAGLPESVVAAAIPLIAPVDWILARLRSAVNVLSDMLVALLLDAWERRSPTV
jgi:DAACS family dicarboxylate/amino acid:cation (Na+ or H+) symporter